MKLMDKAKQAALAAAVKTGYFEGSVGKTGYYHS